MATEKEIAEKVGCTSHYFSEMKHGRKTAGAQLAKRIGALLSCDPGVWCFGSDIARCQTVRKYLVKTKQLKARKLMAEAIKIGGSK